MELIFARIVRKFTDYLYHFLINKYLLYYTVKEGVLKKYLFILVISFLYSTVTDIDGNVYQTVQIGHQVWMTENLKVTNYKNGDSIPTGLDNSSWSSTAEGAYAVYDNDSAIAEIYGNLYNWYAIDDERGVCPDGYHVPSDTDWKKLEVSLGMSSEESNGDEWRG